VALYSVLKDSSRYHFYIKIVGYVSAMRVVMNDLRLDDIASIDPDEMFRQLREDRVSSGLTEYQRVTLCCTWNSIRHCFDDYAERLPELQRQVMEKFFVRRVVDQRRISMTGEWTSWNQQRKARIKAKTDTVHSSFISCGIWPNPGSTKLNECIQQANKRSLQFRHTTFHYRMTIATRRLRRWKAADYYASECT